MPWGRYPRQICELGSNIGTGLAGLAVRYPHATVVGVEPDPDNATIARANVAAFGGRVTLVEAAIWDRPQPLAVEGALPSGYTVRAAREDERSVAGVTLDSLLG